MKFTKADAASRQIDAAIKLHFAAADICSVHTLASAAQTILTDLLRTFGGESWYDVGEAANSDLSPEKYREIFKRSQNFLKHADRDPRKVLDLQEFENDGMLFVATVDYISLIKIRQQVPMLVPDLSPPAQLFQLWCFAAHPEWGASVKPLAAAAELQFPLLSTKPRFEQLAIGGTALVAMSTNRADGSR